MQVVKYLGKNPTRVEVSVWQGWLESAARLASRHMKHDWGEAGEPHDPFSYNECASVSLLASAACCVGMSSLAEYVTLKAAEDKRFSDRNGRCDLWLADKNDRHWEFEFKQPLARVYKFETLTEMMNQSRREAGVLLTRRTKLKERGVTPVAGQIFFSGPLQNRSVDFEDRLIEFCSAGAFADRRRTWVRHAWKLQAYKGGIPTFFLFDVMKKD